MRVSARFLDIVLDSYNLDRIILNLRVSLRVSSLGRAFISNCSSSLNIKKKYFNFTIPLILMARFIRFGKLRSPRMIELT